MIEWWQAVLIALPPSAMTGVLAILVQRYQHRHDGKMQDRRDEVERQRATVEAWRQYNKEFAEPLLAFLRIVERDQARRLLLLQLGEGERERIEEHLRERVDPAVWEEYVRAETTPEIRWQDVLKEYGGPLLTVLNEELRAKLGKLLTHLAAGEKGWLSGNDVADLIVEARGIIATYIIDPESMLGRPEGQGED